MPHLHARCFNVLQAARNSQSATKQARVQAVTAWHSEAQHEAERRREAARRLRLQALKASNMQVGWWCCKNGTIACQLTLQHCTRKAATHYKHDTL